MSESAGIDAALAAIVADRKEVKMRGDYAPSVHLIPKDKSGGRFIQGNYLGSRTVKGEYLGKETVGLVHRFGLLETNAPIVQDKEGQLIDIEKSTILGKEVAVWGFGQMDKFLSGVKINDAVVVMYNGKSDGYHQGRFWILNETLSF